MSWSSRTPEKPKTGSLWYWYQDEPEGPLWVVEVRYNSYPEAFKGLWLYPAEREPPRPDPELHKNYKKVPKKGWAKPPKSRAYHCFFDEKSLCGNWEFSDKLTNEPDGKLCAVCVKKE
jgi:hypothetical protein